MALTTLAVAALAAGLLVEVLWFATLIVELLETEDDDA